MHPLLIVLSAILLILVIDELTSLMIGLWRPEEGEAE